MTIGVQCDLCGKTTAGSHAPADWGYFFRPLRAAVPAAEKEQYLAKQKKDLCERCTYAVEKLIEKLATKLQEERAPPDVTNLLTVGVEKKD
jgi:hypothetical protein